MRYFSAFDGIGAAHSALLPIGYRCVGISEIDRYCCELLNQKYGHRNYGDFTKWREWGKINTDIVVGGSPCQSFSTLGKRHGAKSTTGQLTLEFANFICRNRPKYFMWENVAAVIPSDKGRLFQWLLNRLSQCGYGLAWRVLNCRFFGVPQHRRRVFLIGCFGDPVSAGKVLFETETMSIPVTENQTARQANTPTVTLDHYSDGTQSRWDRYRRERYRQNNPVVGCLTTQIDGGAEQVDAIVIDGNRARYLTPRECERLQGFPDGYTESFSDTQRYRMIGNSMAVPIIRWIGQRILAVDRVTMGQSKAG